MGTTSVPTWWLWAVGVQSQLAFLGVLFLLGLVFVARRKSR